MMTSATWFFIFTGLSGALCGIFGTDVYIRTPMTWSEARKHCRENYIDLSLIEKQDDIDDDDDKPSSTEKQDDGDDNDDYSIDDEDDDDDDDSSDDDSDDDDDSIDDEDDDDDDDSSDDDSDDDDDSVDDEDDDDDDDSSDDDDSDDNNAKEDDESKKTVWTGVYKDANDTEKGSGGTLSSLLGNQGNNHRCMVVDKNGLRAAKCNEQFPFYCYKSSLVLVRENKTWEEAMEDCRSKDMELVSLPSESGLVEVLQASRTAQTAHVWSGLRYFADSWLWVDGTNVKYQPWRQGETPNCPAWTHHCASLSIEGQHLDSWDCADQLNYICYQ